MWIALVKVHYSSLRPFTYINVSDTYAYKLTCEYMSCLSHVDLSISEDDSRPVSVWGELVEAETHTCTRHPGPVRIVRAIRYLRHVVVSRVKVNTHVSSMFTGTAGGCIATVALRWCKEWNWLLVRRRRWNMPRMNGVPPSMDWGHLCLRKGELLEMA